MARKIIKAFLFIFAAILVAGGIMTYLRSQKKIESPLQTQAPKASLPAPVKTSEIKELTVNAQGASAQVQIKGINEHNYSVEHLTTGDGFKIMVPNTAVGQIQSMLDKPHPLIKKIEVHPSAINVGTAELVFHTEKDVNFLDTQKNDTLTIDFIKTESSGDQKTAGAGTSPDKAGNKMAASGNSKTSESTVSKSSGIGSSKSLSKNSAKTSKFAATKKKNTSVAHVSKKKKKGSTKLKPFIDSTDSTDLADNSDLENSVGGLAPDEQGGSINDLKNNQANNLSDFGSTGSAPATEDMPKEEEAPAVAAPTKKPTDAEEGFMNLKDAVKEEPKAPQGSVNLLDAETQMSLTEKTNNGQQVAALPNQKFDINQVQANLPALQNMTVARAGNNTVVTFDREKAIAYKIFRMVNPSRIVVDFKDAKSKLKPDYPRFAGTKISRIETREYGSAEGMLVRVIMYVDGAPNFTSTKNGNQLQIEVQ